MLKILCSLILISAFGASPIFAVRKKPNTITTVGSTTLLPVVQSLAEKFMELHPKVNITVRGGGSGVGIAALIDKTTDIANSSRAIKDKELTTARAKGVNPVGTIIARDAIAIIVHPSNPVKELSLEQLRKIYTGEINKWNEVGGPNKPIVVVSRDVASGTFECFREIVLKGGKTREDALMLASNKAVATTVGETSAAIGYVGIGYISGDVKAVTIEGVLPSKKTAISGEYKITRPLYLYTDGSPKGLIKEFIDFILSKEGQKIVEESGFVPIQ